MKYRNWTVKNTWMQGYHGRGIIRALRGVTGADESAMKAVHTF